MAQEEAWKVLVRQQLQEAAGCCARADGKIAGVLGNEIGILATRIVAIEAPYWRNWVPRAECSLTDASRELAVAASLVDAARLIALRGAAESPAQQAPPPHVSDAPDDNDEGVGVALADQLKDAKDLAETACDLVDLCRAHLCAARLLLDHPLLPGLVGLVNVTRENAHRNLGHARKLEKKSTSLVHEALQRLLL